MKKIILAFFMLVCMNISFAQVRVLYFCDGLAGADNMATALTNMGCTVTSVTTSGDFQTQIATPSNFDMAIHFIQSNWPDPASVNALATFMAIPGKKGMYCDWSRDNTLGAQVGVSFTGSINETTVTITDPALAASLTTNPFTLFNPGWGTFSTGLNALPGGVVAGTFGSGQAALVKTMGDNMLVFGFTGDCVSSPEIFESAITYLSVPTVTTSTSISPVLCANTTINVPYTITGVFTGTNVFTAELSDATGSFASPTVLGSVTSSSAGSISANIPLGTSGTAYRIRVSASDPAVAGSDNGTDLAIDGPAGSFTSTPVMCFGDSSFVTISATGGTSPYMGTGTFMAEAGSHTYTVTDANGCESADISVTITEPAAITHSQSFSICHYEAVTVGTSTYNAAGTYTDILTNIDGCDSTVTTTITIKTVYTATAATDEIIVALAPAPATYQWVNCGTGNSPIAGQTGQFFTATANGSYAVIVTENGCADTSSCTAITTVGISDQLLNESLNIYPNPASGYFMLNSSMSGNVQINLIDIHGKQVFTTQENMQNGYAKSISLQGIAKGLYYVQLTFDGTRITKKLLVE